MSRRISGWRRGFTLVELIAITAVFIGLVVVLVPLLRPRESGCRPMTCRSNLKQIGSALLMYSMDYDDMLPPHATFSLGKSTTISGLLDPYTKNPRIFACPSDSENAEGDGGGKNPPAGYGYNWLALSPMGRPLSLNRVGKPADTVAFVDAAGPNAAPAALAPVFGSGAPIYRHAKTANALWLDGHVNMTQPQKLEEAVSIEDGRILRPGIDQYRLWNVDPVRKPGPEKAMKRAR